MTPLMHAAYKGKAHMCELLLRHGADVNCNQHEYGYTALMFAGLSGRSWHLLFGMCATSLLILTFFRVPTSQILDLSVKHECVEIK